MFYKDFWKRKSNLRIVRMEGPKQCNGARKGFSAETLAGSRNLQHLHIKCGHVVSGPAAVGRVKLREKYVGPGGGACFWKFFL